MPDIDRAEAYRVAVAGSKREEESAKVARRRVALTTDRPPPAADADAQDPQVEDGSWDHERVARAQDGDRTAFDELVLAYQDRIYNLVYRMVNDADEALDLAQESFVKAFQALPRFRRDARFSTWIYRIAVNTCLSRHRRKAVHKHHQPLSLDGPIRTGQGELSPDPGDTTLEPRRESERRETIAAVQATIASLDVEHRTVILLRDMEGYSYEEIQDILGCPIGTVRSRLHRARAELGRRLKRQLKGQTDAEL